MFPTTSAQLPADRGPVTRRTTLALAVGTLLAPGLSACGTDRPLRASGPAPEPAADPDTDADTGLLTAALDAIDEVVVLLTTVRRREASLRASLTPLVRLHEAHRALLTEAAPDQHPPKVSRARLPRRGSARAAVVEREHALAAHLAEAAVAAESGTFARVLASMSAGIGQHVDAHLAGAA